MKSPVKPPTKDEIATMPPFEGLDLAHISLVRDSRSAQAALETLLEAGEVGFDTESKPTFQKGEVSQGPHVIQFSTLDRAYIFQSDRPETRPFILQALENPKLVKIGFGLSSDRQQIAQRFGIRPAAMIDLDHSFKKLGYSNSLGARSAVAILLNRCFIKSKRVTTSNWADKNLDDRQLIYAANDAYAAIVVHHAMRHQGYTA